MFKATEDCHNIRAVLNHRAKRGLPESEREDKKTRELCRRNTRTGRGGIFRGEGSYRSQGEIITERCPAAKSNNLNIARFSLFLSERRRNRNGMCEFFSWRSFADLFFSSFFFHLAEACSRNSFLFFPPNFFFFFFAGDRGWLWGERRTCARPLIYAAAFKYLLSRVSASRWHPILFNFRRSFSFRKMLVV